MFGIGLTVPYETVTKLKTHKTENKTSICPSLNYNRAAYLTNYTLTLSQLQNKEEIVSFLIDFVNLYQNLVLNGHYFGATNCDVGIHYLMCVKPNTE